MYFMFKDHAFYDFMMVRNLSLSLSHSHTHTQKQTHTHIQWVSLDGIS